ncbi:MAG: class I SAM-dependent methyltransferase [Candidimonas sp.]|nr:class I SAM-dependent methyltransferase [Candidimonas sp.]
MNGKTKINFDEYADSYQQLLEEQLSFFSKDRGFFSEHKVAIVADQIKHAPHSILDFGSGIGLSLPYLKKHFPAAHVSATDLSTKSLEYVREKHRGVEVLGDDELDMRSFDLIFVSGVFHHIPIEQRSLIAKRLIRLLTSSGTLFIFEHNPLNPITRRMVSTCPFDEDAVLLSLPSLKRLVSTSGASKVSGGYCLFFPPSLGVVQPLERFMRWLPLGGQHFVAAKK